MKDPSIHWLKLIQYFNGDKNESAQPLFLTAYFFKHLFINHEYHEPPYGTPTERVLTDLCHLS